MLSKDLHNLTSVFRINFLCMLSQYCFASKRTCSCFENTNAFYLFFLLDFTACNKQFMTFNAPADALKMSYSAFFKKNKKADKLSDINFSTSKKLNECCNLYNKI